MCVLRCHFRHAMIELTEWRYNRDISFLFEIIRSMFGWSALSPRRGEGVCWKFALPPPFMAWHFQTSGFPGALLILQTVQRCWALVCKTASTNRRVSRPSPPLQLQLWKFFTSFSLYSSLLPVLKICLLRCYGNTGSNLLATTETCAGRERLTAIRSTPHLARCCRAELESRGAARHAKEAPVGYWYFIAAWHAPRRAVFHRGGAGLDARMRRRRAGMKTSNFGILLFPFLSPSSIFNHPLITAATFKAVPEWRNGN